MAGLGSPVIFIWMQQQGKDTAFLFRKIIRDIVAYVINI